MITDLHHIQGISRALYGSTCQYWQPGPSFGCGASWGCSQRWSLWMGFITDTLLVACMIWQRTAWVFSSSSSLQGAKPVPQPPLPKTSCPHIVKPELGTARSLEEKWYEEVAGCTAVSSRARQTWSSIQLRSGQLCTGASDPTLFVSHIRHWVVNIHAAVGASPWVQGSSSSIWVTTAW